MTAVCETVTIKVTDEAGNSTTRVVPAFTRSFLDMQTQLEGLVAEYLQRATDEREPVSLGDFALYVVAQAAKDPKVI